MVLTNAEKQAAFRKRNADLGRTELRGIYATNEEKTVINAEVKKVLKKMRKTLDEKRHVT